MPCLCHAFLSLAKKSFSKAEIPPLKWAKRDVYTCRIHAFLSSSSLENMVQVCDLDLPGLEVCNFREAKASEEHLLIQLQQAASLE
jgi:hypothetical protein